MGQGRPLSFVSTQRPQTNLRRLGFLGIAAGPVTLLTALNLGGCPAPGPSENVPPVVEAVSITIDADTTEAATLTADDPNGDAITLAIVSLPEHGTLSDANGDAIAEVPFLITAGSAQIAYTPAPGFDGDDAFTYAARDAAAQGDEATVSITVRALVPDVTFSEDRTLDTLSVPAGDSALVENNAVLTITGDATIDGILFARSGRIHLNVTGALTVNGTIRAIDSEGDDSEDDVALSEQTSAVLLVVGPGAVTFASTAVLSSTGPIVITDDDSQLSRTPSDFFGEVENVAADALPTLVPLPPDNPIFAEDGPAKTKLATQFQGPLLPPVVIGGVWPPVGAPAPRGDRPVMIFRIDEPRNIELNNWTVNGPPGRAGANADGTDPTGPNATGGRGRNGMNLNIWNDTGSIRIVNTVQFNLPSGGAGGDARADCATATGGPGGFAGNMRLTAAGGIDISEGALIINPGRGGRGGGATVDPSPVGSIGCPGETGRDGTAVGGKGGDNFKELYARGNVEGIENVSIGAMFGGSGGRATAFGCDGGPGLPCCDGGSGGTATATGGAGGGASLSVRNLPVAVGAVTGGEGGEANTWGGNADEGGDCKLEDGGDGGAGGSATATGGVGGTATNRGGAAVGGNGGDANALGGEGDDGGDSGLGDPGSGGEGGTGVATAGAGGAATTRGADGIPTDADGDPGLDGENFDVFVYCFNFGFLVDGSGAFEPGLYTGVVTDLEGEAQLGTLDVSFAEGATAGYLSENAPQPHIGISDGSMLVELNSLALEMPLPGAITGIRLEPLYATNVSAQRPIVIEALNPDGVVLDSRSFTSIPDNQIRPETPTPVDAEFDLDVPIASFRVVAPQGTFITLFRIYLVDP